MNRMNGREIRQRLQYSSPVFTLMPISNETDECRRQGESMEAFIDSFAGAWEAKRKRVSQIQKEEDATNQIQSGAMAN